MSLSWFGSFWQWQQRQHLSARIILLCLWLPLVPLLIFGVPDSPLAQPRNVIGGNLVAALVSPNYSASFSVFTLDDEWLSLLPLG